MKIIQVCDAALCDNEPLLNIKVGDMTHNFCCKKGFEKSLIEFQKQVKALEIKQYQKN